MKNYEQVKFLLLILLTASLPYHYFASSALIIAGVFLTLYHCIVSKVFNFVKFDKLSVLWIGYFALEVMGLMNTSFENLGTGFSVLEKHQAMVFIPLIFLDFKIDVNMRQKILFFFVLSCFIASVVCVAFNLYSSYTLHNTFFNEWMFSHDRLSKPIGLQAVYFALYLSVALLIILNYLVERNSSISLFKNVMIGVVFIMFFLMVIALGARTITVALMCTIILNLIYYALSRKSKLMLLLAAVVPLIFSLIILLNPVVKTRFMDMLKSNYELSNYGSYFARSKIWIPGLEAIEENIWFGVGTGDSQSELDKKFVEHGYLEGVQVFNMHNQYFQTLLDLGIIGLCIFLTIFYVQVREALSQRNLLYLSFLIVFLGGCLTESMLNRNKGIVFVLVFSFVFFKSGRLKGTQAISK